MKNAKFENLRRLLKIFLILNVWFNAFNERNFFDQVAIDIRIFPKSITENSSNLMSISLTISKKIFTLVSLENYGRVLQTIHGQEIFLHMKPKKSLGKSRLSTLGFIRFFLIDKRLMVEICFIY